MAPPKKSKSSTRKSAGRKQAKKPAPKKKAARKKPKKLTPKGSAAELRGFLKEAGVSLKSMTPEVALDLMARFYESVPAAGCDRSDDGDMLLFQCGVHDWGDGPEFSLDFVRQFIESSSEDAEGDDDISQLHLELFFDPATAGASECAFNVWCADDDELEEFRAAVVDSDGFKLMKGCRPVKVELKLGGV
jgi:hypothetical protein